MKFFSCLLALVLSFLTVVHSATFVERYERGYAAALIRSFEVPCYAVVYDEIGQVSYPREFSFNLTTMLPGRGKIRYAYHDIDDIKTGVLEGNVVRANLSMEARKSMTDYPDSSNFGVEPRGARSSMLLEFCGPIGLHSGSALAVVEAGAKVLSKQQPTSSPFRIIALDKYTVPMPRSDVDPQLVSLPDQGYNAYGISYTTAKSNDVEPRNTPYHLRLYWFNGGSAVGPIIEPSFEDPNYRLLVPALGISFQSGNAGSITSWSSVEFGYHPSSNTWLAMDINNNAIGYKGASVGYGHIPVNNRAPLIVYVKNVPTLREGKVFHVIASELMKELRAAEHASSPLARLEL